MGGGEFNMTIEEIILKNIIWIIGILVHALWTYWRVGELDKKVVILETKLNSDIKDLSKERDNLANEIGKLREAIASMNGKLDLLVKDYKK